MFAIVTSRNSPVSIIHAWLRNSVAESTISRPSEVVWPASVSESATRPWPPSRMRLIIWALEA